MIFHLSEVDRYTPLVFRRYPGDMVSTTSRFYPTLDEALREARNLIPGAETGDAGSGRGPDSPIPLWEGRGAALGNEFNARIDLDLAELS